MSVTSRASVPHGGPVGNGSSIVLVDDDGDSRELLKEILSLNGFRVETASTGQDGIQLATTLKPNLVIVDLGLPDLDGYDLAARLRGMKETSNLPIVAVTGRQPSRRLEARDLRYFDEFITKPFDFAKLIQTIQPLLGSTNAKLLSADETSEGEAPMADLKQSYEGRLSGRIQSIQELWFAHREWPDGHHLHKLWKKTHNLAGSAPLYGFESIGRIARAIEESVADLLGSAPTVFGTQEYDDMTKDIAGLIEEMMEQRDQPPDLAGSLEIAFEENNEGGARPRTEGRVLVVDDDPELLEYLSDHLARQGYDVDLASDAQSALEAIRQSPPEIIIADVRMPGIDGVEFCRQVRAEGFHDIPFIFCSGLGSAPKRVEGLRAGADDYLVKPIVTEELDAKIHRLIDSHRRLLSALDQVRERKSTGICSGDLEAISIAEALQSEIEALAKTLGEVAHQRHRPR